MVPELEDALHLDYETRGTVNLPKAGPWVYGEHWATSVWTACFARGGRPVEAWHPGDPVPRTIERAIEDGVPWVAHNVGFERAITATQMAPKFGWPIVPIEQWYCTASMAAAMCLPRKLEDAARLLNCSQQKDMDGHKLMLKMMKPHKRVACLGCNGSGQSGFFPCALCDGHGEILYWFETPDAIARGTEYCKQDVETERALAAKLRPLSVTERKVWILDQKINERGVRVDLSTVDKSLKIVKTAVAELNDETQLLTGGHRDEDDRVVGGVLASQVKKLRVWLAAEGLYLSDLRKETVEGLLASANLDDLVKQALELRQEAAKTSTAKLNAFAARTCADSRMRDNLMYHAAGTGRWGGRGAQLQNLPSRFLLKKWQIEAALRFIAVGCDGEFLRAFFDKPLEVISACLRGMVVAGPGQQLYAGDYNAIEARGTAWLAGAKNLLNVFSTGQDPYLYQASGIYGYDCTGRELGLSLDDAKAKFKPERALGKIAVLGLGYQMGWEKFQATCAKERIFITDGDAVHTVTVYREDNWEIKDLWKEMNSAAIEAVRRPEIAVPVAEGKVRFLRVGTWLYMQLPSGRLLSYAAPRLEMRELPWLDENTGEPAKGWGVTFMGVNSLTHKWSKQYGYGGKWTENAVQGLCRDLLASAMLRLEDAGYPQIVSVHDESVAETPISFGSVKEYEQIMCDSPAWAAGLPVAAEGWVGARYRK